MKGIRNVPKFVWLITTMIYLAPFIFRELTIINLLFWLFVIPTILFAYYAGVRGGVSITILSTTIQLMGSLIVYNEAHHMLHSLIEVGLINIILTVVIGFLVRKLLMNEYQYRTLTEKAQIGVYIYQNNTFLFVNDQMERIFGFSKNEFKRISPLQLAATDDTTQLRKLMNQNMNQDDKGDIRFKAFTKQLETIYVDMNGTWITYHGKPALIGKVQDCTDQMKAEEEINLLNRQMMEILENMNDAFYTLDDKSRFTYVNPSAELLLRKSRRELLGNSVSDMFIGADLMLEHHFQKAKEENSFVELEEFYEPLDLWFEARIYPSSGSISVFFRDITDKKNTEARISQMAYHDALTGLPNRYNLHEYLSKLLVNLKNGSPQQALLFMDLDGYKTFNDTLGHRKGDQLLIQVANRLSECVKDGFVSRIGGDEFAIIVSSDQSGFAAEKILQHVSQPYQLDEYTKIILTASMGIALIPDDGITLDQLLVHADVAMYQAKAQGKNRYVRFSYEHLKKMERKVWLENEIRNALDEDAFMLYYQPQVNVNNGQITGVEALIRWKHAEQGFISPVEFIPIIEETGQMNRLTEWALRTACHQVIQWQQDQLYIRIAVNISTSSLNQNTLSNLMMTVFNETGVSPEYIQLEITESIAALEPQFVIKQLTELKKCGLTIAIDDFGTGYSSLSNLGLYPVDKLKIDRSFIQALRSSHDSNAAAIIEGITAMAQHLKMIVIAEGVETEEELNFLRKAGCDEIQGYLFSRPLPSQEVTKLLLQNKCAPPIRRTYQRERNEVEKQG